MHFHVGTTSSTTIDVNCEENSSKKRTGMLSDSPVVDDGGFTIWIVPPSTKHYMQFLKVSTRIREVLVPQKKVLFKNSLCSRNFLRDPLYRSTFWSLCENVSLF